MKKITLTIILSFIAVAIFAQSFEGKIVYKNTYKSKSPGLGDEQLTAMMGAVMNYYMQGANYKSDINGQLLQWQIFVSADSKLYTKMSNSEAALWTDATVNSDEVLSSELHKGVTEILGYKCDELVLNCKTGVQKYYFTSQFAVDSKLYANHKYGNWYGYLSKSNAIPLKMVIDAPQFSMESVATEVKAMKLDAAMFALPAGITTTKSPF